MSVLSIYVEKRPEFAVEAASVKNDLILSLHMQGLRNVRIVNRYLVQNISQEDFDRASETIFSEPPVDVVSRTLPDFGSAKVIAVEALPGQFDQRADSCEQCISLATGKERPLVRTARIYVLEGDLSEKDLEQIQSYLINPVESREASLEVPSTLETHYPIPEEVEILTGFINLKADELAQLCSDLGLAMNESDLAFCQEYFSGTEKRDPTITELRMIDTYWSDHCRHTTFLTHLEDVEIDSPEVKKVWDRYIELRGVLYGDRDKPITLMDMATIGAKALKKQGMLDSLDESEEINACSVKITVDVDGREEDWLLMFKNETHNHPTEIEPFGGAATCLGGAIRDPLSGRSYVYQAMRVTGAANPLEDAEKTMPGKLSQRKIVQTAAAGYSSYGNQIGLATGHVHEIYHPGYVAKRMEIGAVVGAAPAANVVRDVPKDGDVVILLGGRTGRDGCGGATGSSKSHTQDSLQTCGAQVQKGNAPEERKIQRLFRNPEATRLIRRCNDFGAGGVSVSIGELADGVHINLDAVPKKYDGLDGTELAISESQERMSIVVDKKDADRFIELASAENLEATVVATITQTPRLVMQWQGKTIVDLSREFLNSNGAPQHARVSIPDNSPAPVDETPITGESLVAHMASLQACSQKGLVERFDSTVGAGTVLMPFGGEQQLTPAQAMAAKIPVLGETSTCSIMAWGFDPNLSSQSTYHGAAAAVVESVAKVIAAGGSRKQCWLTFQEYFERLRDEPIRWGKPAAALLGALEAQLELGIASIGGKDSMSGSFEDIDVPPTLVSFAVSVGKADRICSPEFKQVGSRVYLLRPDGMVQKPSYESVGKLFDTVEELVHSGRVRAAWAVGSGGIAEAVTKMCFGNRIGLEAATALNFAPYIGGFILEADELPGWEHCEIGRTIDAYVLRHNGETIDLETVQKAWEQTLEPVFPYRTQPKAKQDETCATSIASIQSKIVRTGSAVAKPRVVIPVFPGTNCEYDTARAFDRAGAQTKILVVRNLSAQAISESIEEMEKEIAASQIIAIPGGFSGGDEPDGSGKFITAFFRNPKITEAVHALLARDGLICGICNGFQALIKLGLLTHGEIRALDGTSPTLTHNQIGRHQSMLVRTKVLSNHSPWLSRVQVGEVYTVPVSHGEGRFVANEEQLQNLWKNGQIASVYVDEQGNPTQDIRYNPNGSLCAIEGITSPDGRIFGKMAHNERYGENLYRNVPGNKFMDIFGGAVDYFK